MDGIQFKVIVGASAAGNTRRLIEDLNRHPHPKLLVNFEFNEEECRSMGLKKHIKTMGSRSLTHGEVIDVCRNHSFALVAIDGLSFIRNGFDLEALIHGVAGTSVKDFIVTTYPFEVENQYMLGDKTLNAIRKVLTGCPEVSRWSLYMNSSVSSILTKRMERNTTQGIHLNVICGCEATGKTTRLIQEMNADPRPQLLVNTDSSGTNIYDWGLMPHIETMGSRSLTHGEVIGACWNNPFVTLALRISTRASISNV